ncbi:MAG: sulfatase [Planctomycetota bacterium]|nr:sulfatase [Planctomycetota bacterium]
MESKIHSPAIEERKMMLRVLVTCFALLVFITPAQAKPNVLIITVDDMSADSIGAYGCPIENISPHMDGLVRSGLRFQYAHVQVGNCMPGRNVMWSGLYPHNNQVEGFYQVSQPKHKHLVDLMKQAGYFTAIMGKTSHSTPYHPYLWDAVLDTAEDGSNYDKKNPSHFGEATERGIEAAANVEKPFCLMVNVSDPHKPFFSGDGDKNQPSMIVDAADVPVPGFLFDDPVVRQELALYYSSVSRADDCVGEILEALNSSGAKDDTVVVFLSDHGMPLPFAKTQLYHHSTHTPLAIRWPGITQPDTIDQQHMVSAVDLTPTILDIVGAELPKLDGRSFAPVLRGESQTDREYVVKEYNENSGRSRDPIRAVQTKKYLYLANAWSNGTRVFATATTGTQTYRRMAALAGSDEHLAKRLAMYKHRVPEEFYDVEKDPDCLENLIESPEHQEMIQLQRERLLQWMRQTNDHMLDCFENFDDPQARESYVLAKEEEAASRKKRNVPQPKNQKVFTITLPRPITAATKVKYIVRYDLPKNLGSQGIVMTLKQGKNGERVDRKEATIQGKGQLVVEFDIPSNPKDSRVSFATWVGSEFAKNIQYYHSDPIPVKYLDD